MSDHQHYTGCHLHHFVCAQDRIRELERENRDIWTRLMTYALTEHELMARAASPAFSPCHDHIEPTIVSGGPTWKAHQDDPPSFTP